MGFRRRLLVGVGDEEGVGGAVEAVFALDVRGEEDVDVAVDPGCSVVLSVGCFFHLSETNELIILTSTVEVDSGTLSGGAGLGVTRYSFEDIVLCKML